MLINPFTPSEIASEPNEFFGRANEIHLLERALQQGSVVIQGPIGIGKSSLLSHIRLLMEGFSSKHKSISFIAVGNKDITSLDDAARLILESFVFIDERQNKVAFKLGNLCEFGSTEIITYFKEKRHLAILKQLVQNEYINMLLNDSEYLLIAIDEVDKCPIPIAQVIRNIVTHTQQMGVKRLRFIITGVSPFFDEMVKEDAGINRFFYKKITLQQLSPIDALELVDSKFSLIINEAKKNDLMIEIEEDLSNKIVQLSGGHPHLVQLLGSHVVERENSNPDNKISKTDLLDSLRKICYEERGTVYETTLHLIEVYGMKEEFQDFILSLPANYPTLINKDDLLDKFTAEQIHTLLYHNILSQPLSQQYGLVDEFLRTRILFDSIENMERIREAETGIIMRQSSPDMLDRYRQSLINFEEYERSFDEDDDGEDY